MRPVVAVLRFLAEVFYRLGRITLAAETGLDSAANHLVERRRQRLFGGAE